MRNMLKIVRFVVNKVMELINDTIQYLCYKNNFFLIFFKRLKNMYCSTYKILYGFTNHSSTDRNVTCIVVLKSNIDDSSAASLWPNSFIKVELQSFDRKVVVIVLTLKNTRVGSVFS
jgi:hypothetical protein